MGIIITVSGVNNAGRLNLNPDALAENSVSSNPAVDATSVVSNLIAVASDKVGSFQKLAVLQARRQDVVQRPLTPLC